MGLHLAPAPATDPKICALGFPTFDLCQELLFLGHDSLRHLKHFVGFSKWNGHDPVVIGANKMPWLNHGLATLN
jgi:hypothetical protein